jgi:hypothetical protein
MYHMRYQKYAIDCNALDFPLRCYVMAVLVQPRHPHHYNNNDS